MNNVFIFHGTEGYPEENWFPWLKQELEQKGYKVFVPQFPSPPIVSAQIVEWFDVLKNMKRIRTKKNMSQGDIARALEVDRGYIRTHLKIGSLSFPT